MGVEQKEHKGNEREKEQYDEGFEDDDMLLFGVVANEEYHRDEDTAIPAQVCADGLAGDEQSDGQQQARYSHGSETDDEAYAHFILLEELLIHTLSSVSRWLDNG